MAGLLYIGVGAVLSQQASSVRPRWHTERAGGLSVTGG
jgi:hypothetical protein